MPDERPTPKYRASALDVVACDVGWVVIVKLYAASTTVVCETAERLAAVLAGIEWVHGEERGNMRHLVENNRARRALGDLGGSGEAAQSETAR